MAASKPPQIWLPSSALAAAPDVGDGDEVGSSVVVGDGCVDDDDDDCVGACVREVEAAVAQVTDCGRSVTPWVVQKLRA